MKKRLLSLLLVCVLGVGMLTACGDTTGNSENSGTEDTSAKDTGAGDTSDAGEELVGIRKELTALELTKLMGNGINLGNTMEACDTKLGPDKSTSTYETLWGQPVTTQEMITSMKEAGFDSIRIPVAWANTMDWKNGDYTISEDYLNRVEEIVNYALKEDMYVVMNDHWDSGWWGMFGQEDQKMRDAAMEMYTSMWTQIANHFKDYSDYLIFEAGNEELGNRLNDAIDGKAGVLTEDECYEMANKINQKFVDVVRGTGGNNAYRFLLIAGYNTNIADTVDNRFVMPTDTVESKLLISVHYYDPSGYCIQSALSSWGTEEQFDDMNNELRKMTMFTSQGYGVIIGEYSVFPENADTLKKGALPYFENFLANCDQYNFNSMLWDTNSLFLKDGSGFWDDDLADLYLEYSYDKQKDIEDKDLVAQSKATKEELKANAEGSFILPDDKAIAWIMYNSSDWSIQHAVGDEYDPNNTSVGVVPTDVYIEGAGTYTVALDFTGTTGGYANSVVFSAIGIDNGESLYPGYFIEIKSLKINGEEYALTGKGYTTSDDQNCTRINLYNEWITKLPDDARCLDGDVSMVTPCIIDPATLGNVKTIEVTFEYVAP